jgi:hypothetical protein
MVSATRQRQLFVFVLRAQVARHLGRKTRATFIICTTNVSLKQGIYTYLSRLIDTVTNCGTHRGALSANLSEPSSVTEMNGVKMPVKKCMRRDPTLFFGFLDFFSMNCIQHCFICRPLESPLCRRKLGSNPGLLRLRHGQSDALNHQAKSHPLLLSSRWVRPPSAM